MTSKKFTRMNREFDKLTLEEGLELEVSDRFSLWRQKETYLSVI